MPVTINPRYLLLGLLLIAGVLVLFGACDPETWVGVDK